MTTSPEPGFVPELTLGWRLRMARESTGLGLREFAEQIGVSADTCTSAERDRRKVRPITLNAYALATGVSREWLETGRTPVQPKPDGGPGGYAITDSNREPAGMKHSAPGLRLLHAA